jgi:hypothetical protein
MMMERLKKAVEQLSPEQLEQLTEYAESLAAQAGEPEQPQFLKLDWVGKAADAYPEHASGVEAAHAIPVMIIESIERSLSKPRT